MLTSWILSVIHACCQLHWMKERENYHSCLLRIGSDQSGLKRHLTFFSLSTLKCILQFQFKTGTWKASLWVQLGESSEWETSSLNTEQLQAGTLSNPLWSGLPTSYRTIGFSFYIAFYSNVKTRDNKRVGKKCNRNTASANSSSPALCT